MLCIRDQNLALSLHAWWVSIWTGINVNSNCNNAYQRESWCNINQFPLLSIVLNCSTIAKYFNKPQTKSYALPRYNPKQYICTSITWFQYTEQILMLTSHRKAHSVTNFWSSTFAQVQINHLWVTSKPGGDKSSLHSGIYYLLTIYMRTTYFTGPKYSHWIFWLVLKLES